MKELITILRYVISQIIGKILPIAFAFLIARNIGLKEYSKFVEIILLTSLLIGVSTVFNVQLILSSYKFSENQAELMRKAYIFAFIVCLVGTFAYSQIDAYEISSAKLVFSLFVFCYSLSMSILAINNSKLNACFENLKAANNQIYHYLIIYGTGLTSVLLKFDFQITMIIIILGILAVNIQTLKKVNLNINTNIWLNSIPRSTEQFYLFTYVSLVMGANFICVKYANKNFSVTEAALFSLGFQMYGIGIFLPSTLGNILIPKLIQNKNSTIRSRAIYVYITLALTWILVIFACDNLILKYYKLNLHSNEALLFSSQLCVLISVINAYLSQLYISLKRFHYLAIGSCIYFFIMLACIYCFNTNFQNYIYCCFYACLSTFAYYAYIYSKHKFIINSD